MPTYSSGRISASQGPLAPRNVPRDLPEQDRLFEVIYTRIIYLLSTQVMSDTQELHSRNPGTDDVVGRKELAF